MSGAEALEHRFVIPPALRVSGGNLYNTGLLAALSSLGVGCSRLDLEQALEAVGSSPAQLWVDSLYLDAFAELARRLHPGAELGLLTHYLPTLVRLGDYATRTDLSEPERFALARANAFIVPSATFAERLRGLGVDRPVHVIEPGLFDPEAPPRDSVDARVNAVTVSTLLPGKGVLALLEALGAALQPDDAFTLRVIGSEQVDPGYAAACRRSVEADPLLARAVTFLGELPPDRVGAELVRSSLYLSASRMESYGMALAEAHHLGVPILTLRGGHAAVHAVEAHGGRSCDDVGVLVRMAMERCRVPELHRRLQLLAMRATFPRRSWRDAAEDFRRVAARSGTVHPR